MASSTSEVQYPHVIITLDACDPNPITFLVPNRRIELTKSNHVLPLGRASKTEAKPFVPNTDNGWIIGAVVSRNHAELIANFDEKVIRIRDVQSLHGTYINNEDEPLERGTQRQLHNGDTIRFGARILRGNDTFEPSSVRFGSEFVDAASPDDTSDKPVVFCLDDIESSDDESLSDEDNLPNPQLLSSTPCRPAEDEGNAREPKVIHNGHQEVFEELANIVGDLTHDRSDSPSYIPDSPTYSPRSPRLGSPYSSAGSEGGEDSVICLTDDSEESEVEEEEDLEIPKWASDDDDDLEEIYRSDEEDLDSGDEGDSFTLEIEREIEPTEHSGWARPLATPPYYPPRVGNLVPNHTTSRNVLSVSQPHDESPEQVGEGRPSEHKPSQCTLAAILNPSQGPNLEDQPQEKHAETGTDEQTQISAPGLEVLAASAASLETPGAEPASSPPWARRSIETETEPLDLVIAAGRATLEKQQRAEQQAIIESLESMTTPLLNSGSKFLNSPPQDETVADVLNNEDEGLSSATAFRERIIMASEKHDRSPLKRKFQSINSAESTMSRTATMNQPTSSSQHEPASTEEPLEPARKRVRKNSARKSNKIWAVAEKVAFAALGGVVVLSSLIYTAPSFT